MKKVLLLLAVAATVCLTSCRRAPHFITDPDYSMQVHNDFCTRMQGVASRVAPQGLDTLCRAEREAMQFLYAYMPLSDLADYPESFFLQQVRSAFQAREEMPWGKTVPEDVFRHFVLVYRVNNENLDTARQLMYRELKDRVSGMSMEQAALEVNHWCHEHVAYRASDGRTSAPLATMRTSLGRCGEESTFTVTALRAVGIPARQCYTPRWAHCDDNHAWVEVWVDGQWKFCGACEPDPRLDMGWFAIPSTRCMMVHSKAFGRYHGDEEVVRRTGLYSELNLLSHYAPTRKLTVSVTDAEGHAVEGAKVRFKLYNYAEYYPLSTQITDKDGKASLTTGLGDLLIWATDGERMAYGKIDVRQDSTLTLALRTVDEATAELCAAPITFEMVPPAVGQAKVVPTVGETEANARRLAYEDSLRNAYTATFPTRENYVRLLPDGVASDAAWDIIHRSEGNYAELAKFMQTFNEDERYYYLHTFSDKDMRDITAEVLEAHLTSFTDMNVDYEVYERGILPARISNEMVRPYREELAAFRSWTSEEIRQWVLDSIAISDTNNYFGAPLSPVGVYRLRVSDRHSRDIFYVAACRAAGVPAYLDNATGELFVWNGKQWEKNSWNSAISSTSATSSTSITGATLTLYYRGTDPAKPVYWPHFTLAKLEDGDLRTFDFEDDPRMASFPATLDLEPGIYCLSTGNRYPDGAVRSRLEFFELKAGEKARKEIVILPLLARTDEMGKLDASMQIWDDVSLSDYAAKTGFLYVNLGDYSEPSKHLIVELRQQQAEMKKWGGMTYMVGPANIGMAGWNLANTDLAFAKGALEESLLQALRIDLAGNYPLVALVAQDGTILYHSEGYKIGVVEQVLKAAKQ